jgi:thiol-disulfide isomerase/thioredoxin
MMVLKNAILALLVLAGINSMAQDKFEIAGHLSAVKDEKKVILTYVNSEGKNVSDSTVLRDGRFHISGMTAFGNKAQLLFTPMGQNSAHKNGGADYQSFYLERGNYRVNGTDNVANASITGTSAQADFNEFNLLSKELLKQFKDITQRFSKVYYAKVKDTVAIQAIQAEARPVHAKIERVLDSFIFSHPDSYVALDLILENKSMVIDPATFGQYYNPLSKRVLESFNGQRLTSKYQKAQQIALGKSVDFSQPDVNGNLFKLSSLKGKYVLVDFWASWCVPCRAENPHLLKAYRELKDKNFEIVSVSLDDDRAAWLKAVKQDGLPWLQVSELKGFKTDVAVRYGISAIPQNFLINPAGIIVAKDLRGEQVNQKIASFIK